ncbi:hypothetical protein K8R04_01970 [Candidatus Uhrbacteria bacterium]|nr:hypothetical protein [Candidatus Uhrbacteria bacterium]
MDSVEDRSTVPPPPDGPLFTVQLFYPNNIPLAKQVSLHLKTRIHVEDRMLQTHEMETLPSGMFNVDANLIIVGIDEFCDLKDIFQAVRRYFRKSAPIVTHLAAPIAMDQSLLVDYSVIGTFVQYDFDALISLVKAALENKLIPLEGEIILDAD